MLILIQLNRATTNEQLIQHLSMDQIISKVNIMCIRYSMAYQMFQLRVLVSRNHFFSFRQDLFREIFNRETKK